jgi:hypothetical protein
MGNGSDAKDSSRQIKAQAMTRHALDLNNEGMFQLLRSGDIFLDCCDFEQEFIVDLHDILQPLH